MYLCIISIKMSSIKVEFCFHLMSLVFVLKYDIWQSYYTVGKLFLVWKPCQFPRKQLFPAQIVLYSKPVFMSCVSTKNIRHIQYKNRSLTFSHLLPPFQRCVGCSARMEECVSGPTPAPVPKAGWADFVRSVSFQLPFSSVAGMLTYLWSRFRKICLNCSH